MHAPKPKPVCPEKIGKYEIVDVAGSGAMGDVYVGYDPFIERLARTTFELAKYVS